MLQFDDSPWLKIQFLVALPSLQDGLFAHSITYMCEHDERGAMGIVINRPLDMNLSDIFSYLEIEFTGDNDALVFAGGPVNTDRGFVLHRKSAHTWESTMQVGPELCLTTSMDILRAIAAEEGPEHSLIALGYAGWGAGQLEDEIQRNAWLTVPADDAIIFDTPFQHRFNSALAKLGVDESQLSMFAGHV